MDDLKQARRIMVVTVVFFWFSQYAFVPYLTPYLGEMGASPALIGYVAAAYGLTQVFIRIPLGIFADRTGLHKQLLVIGCALGCVAVFGMGTFQSPVAVMLFRGLSGAVSSVWVIFTVLYVGYFDMSGYSKAMGDLNVFNNLGKLLAFFAGAVVVGFFGYRASFYICCVSAAVCTLVALKIKKSDIAPKDNSIKSYLALFKNKQLLYMSGFGALSFFLQQTTVFTFNSTIAETQLGAGSIELSAATAIYTASHIAFSGLLGTKTARKIGEKNIIVFSFAVCAACCVGFVAVTSIWLFFVMQFVFGAGMALMMPLMMASAIRQCPPEKKSTAMGFYQAVYAIGMTIGPIAMGNIAGSFGYAGAYYAFAAIGLASAVLFYISADRVLTKMPPAAK